MRNEKSHACGTYHYKLATCSICRDHKAPSKGICVSPDRLPRQSKCCGCMYICYVMPYHMPANINIYYRSPKRRLELRFLCQAFLQATQARRCLFSTEYVLNRNRSLLAAVTGAKPSHNQTDRYNQPTGSVDMMHNSTSCFHSYQRSKPQGMLIWIRMLDELILHIQPVAFDRAPMPTSADTQASRGSGLLIGSINAPCC